jgi:hypothetical protein
MSPRNTSNPPFTVGSIINAEELFELQKKQRRSPTKSTA